MPLAPPIPSLALAAPLTKAARFAPSPVTQEKGVPGVLESSGLMPKDSFKPSNPTFPVSLTEKLTQAARSRAESHARVISCPSHAFSPSPCNVSGVIQGLHK